MHVKDGGIPTKKPTLGFFALGSRGILLKVGDEEDDLSETDLLFFSRCFCELGPGLLTSFVLFFVAGVHFEIIT